MSRTALVLALSCPAAFALGDVRFVDDDGPADFALIQAAIDASTTGDAVVVRPGTYAGFTIDGLGVHVIGIPGAEVAGAVRVQNLEPGQLAALSNLVVRGQNSRALVLADNSGSVRVQSCELVGMPGGSGCQFDDNTPAVLVQMSSDVFFARCTLSGGPGGSGFCLEPRGGDGREGATFIDSSVALYDCELRGGAGGATDSIYFGNTAGHGGDGCRARGSFVFASNTVFAGGPGGNIDCYDDEIGFAGSGGDGLEFVDGYSCDAKSLGSSYAGGAGGDTWDYGFICEAGLDGQGLNNASASSLEMLAGASRTMKTLHQALDGTTVQAVFRGVPGDVVYLQEGITTGFRYSPAERGVWQLPTGPLGLGVPLGVIPASGVFRKELLLPQFAIPPGALALAWQSLFEDTGGQRTLGTPNTMQILPHACAIVSYCSSAPHSAGAGAVISATGTTSVSANDLALVSAGGVPDVFGLFFYGPTQTEMPFGDGFLCVGDPLYRLIPPVLADSGGTAALALDFAKPPLDAGPGAAVFGQTWNFQHWFRDPASTLSGFNSTNGLSVTFCP